MKKRILSILLICCMVLTMLPATALAEESGQTGGGVTASGLCEHHPAHDDECGYTEGTAGTPCSHEHTDDCYTEVTDCVHEHTEDCYPQNSVSGNNATSSNADEPTECTHVCSEESGCITKQLNCQHEHDEDCGYTPATAGTPCGYVCEICGAEGNAAEAMTVERVQAMIDALPDAEEITEDNAEEVTAQLEAIDEAKAELTDEEIDELDITRYMAAAAALGSLAAPMLLANAAPAEQFNLTPGGTYWFDLSGENIPGTDTTLHYVPFTYAGTVDAYKLTSEMQTTEDYAEQNKYPHSLFVADYAVTHTVSWNELNNAGLIFGKSYTGGSVDYTLRAPSMGSWYTGSGDSQRGTPQSNEWDAVLDKNSGYIKNWNYMFSQGQDTTYGARFYRAIRGHDSARCWNHNANNAQNAYLGFRPVLEVLNTDTLGPDGLKAVTLDLNGGKLGGSTDNIQIIVKNGAAFTAPASDGLTAPTEYNATGFKWQDSDGNLYAPGDSVPAGVTLLTAKWVKKSVSTEDELREALDAGATSIKLVGDIKLSSTLDLTDKNITLDLNGYVLTGNIQLADSSASPDSILTLIDSNPTATHADSSLPAGGVVKGNITLTRGSGSVSHLYANGGTVTGQTSLPSYAGGIFCTSDTPTAFTGYVGNYGEIHGGIFYAGINESCIKENIVTFMNGDSRYALEVVASGDKVVAPVSTPLKAGYDFVGWYNGDTKYEFNQTITSDITLTAQWTPAEQFNLTPGGTYWFDLSGENIPGTVNTGNSYGAVSVPDTTLHYVPFTYAGTVDAYKLTSAMETTEDYAEQNKYPHSLFVADYAVTRTVSWDELNTAGLIFGKSYTGGSVDYTLRAPSVGSWYTGSGDSAHGTPQSNEWDAVLDKNSSYIKNWYRMLSWGQDTARSGSSYHALRGYSSARNWDFSSATYQYVIVGFRPVLEVLNTGTLGSDGLKAVTLDLNGGKLGGSADNIQIIVKNGAAFTAPASDGLTRPDGDTGSFFIWKGSNGNLYAPGDSVPADVTTLTAQWTPAEQFNLTPGGTYWFDLSGENIPGTVNTGNSYGAVSVPDTTLHYVPFTYAGTVDAYKLTSAMETTEDYAEQNKYPHSLFVADYAVTSTVSWDELNTAGLIFGKSYTGGSVAYTLRAPSVGSWHTGSYDLGTPQSNEWDAVLDKNSGYIKNWNGIYSWGQDTSRYNSSYRAVRGYGSARLWGCGDATYQPAYVGFRPVLEVLNTDTLGSDGLKAVTLDLNGGKLGGSADDIQIIVKNGAAFTAPASDGLTAPQVGYSAQWQDSDGNLYAPGDSVPADVTTLTAQWTDTYTVTLNKNGGTIASGKDVTEYTYGTGATLPTADDITRDGHTFEGWYEDENFSGSPVTEISATDTGKKEFYAKWEQKANAGLSVDAVPEKTYGDPAFQLNVHADSDGKVTYSSDNVNTATVDENGTVTIHQVGTATLTIRIAETAKYLPGEVTVTITVVRKNATLTVEKLTYSVTYGDADFIIGYASEGESSVTFTSSNEKVATVDKNGVVHIVSAGSATITLNMEQSGNYNAVSKKVEVIVAPKAITVTADNQTKIYGGDDPKLTYTADGLVNGDTLTGIALTREAGTNVGQYDITLSQQTGANPNYSITFVKGALTINPLTAQLSWSNTSLTYNGKVQKPVAAVSNLLPGDTCTVTVTGGQTDAGSYTATATALSNGNYKLPENVEQTFVIAPKNITVTITPNGGVYAGTITPAAAELTGVCEGDTVEVTLTYTGTANDGTVVNSTDTPTLAGTYTVTATIADSNYNLTGTNTAEFVVAKANAGLSVGTVPEKTYGDAAFKLDVHADSDGKVTYSSDNEDTATVDENGTVTLHNAGTATLTVEIAETANYEGGKVTVTITVVRKNATLTVEKLTYSVTYGDADFIIGYASEGESSVTFTSSNEKVATVDKNGVVHIVSAGSATITLNMEQSGNYNAVSKKVEVIVAPKAITVTADDQTKTYGEDDPKLTYTADGLVNGDTLTGIALTREAGTNVGQYEITLSQQTGANPNYEITFVPGTLTIAARDIADAEVELGAALIANGKTQEQNNQRVTVRNAKGEELEVTYTVTGNQATEPGAYTMTITGTGNFTGTVTKTFVIAPAADSKVDTNESGDVVIGKGTISVEVVQETGAPEAEIRTGKAAIIEMLVASGDLTAEELSQVGDGASIRVLLKVTVASTTITEESKAQIEKAAEGYVIGQYIDISLFKQTICNGQAGELIRLTGTYEEMEISLVVPENLLNRDNSVTRTFWIIRNHDGKVEFLPATYDAQTNTLTFKTDKFSDYAIVYKDAKKAAENPTKPDNTATGTSPQTGDPAILWIWFVLLFISCGGVITTIYIGKRKKDKAE